VCVCVCVCALFRNTQNTCVYETTSLRNTM